MGTLARLKMIWRGFTSAIRLVLEVFPPYLKIEGILVTKEVTRGGRHYILVDGDMVGVDRVTYGELLEGEPLRIRATRGYRAVNIDRLIP